MKRLLICDCGSWGLCPLRFYEKYHFGKCPTCGRTMKLTNGVTPEEVALPTNRRVIPEIISQKTGR